MAEDAPLPPPLPLLVSRSLGAFGIRRAEMSDTHPPPGVYDSTASMLELELELDDS